MSEPTSDGSGAAAAAPPAPVAAGDGDGAGAADAGAAADGDLVMRGGHLKKAFAPNLGAAGRKTKGKVRTHHLAALLFLHARECSACWCVLRARRRPTAALRDPGRRDPKVHQWSIMALHLVQQSVIPCVELGPALARVLVMHWRSGIGSEWAKSGNTAMLTLLKRQRCCEHDSSLPSTALLWHCVPHIRA
jgi:hypothetical protein